MSKTAAVIHPLAVQAVKALHDDSFTTERGMCQKFVRQNIERLYGGRYSRFRAGTADAAARLWRESEFAIEGGGWGQVGDIYYWYASHGQPDGHTAIRIPGNQVAENSSFYSRA